MLSRDKQPTDKVTHTNMSSSPSSSSTFGARTITFAQLIIEHTFMFVHKLATTTKTALSFVAVLIVWTAKTDRQDIRDTTRHEKWWASDRLNVPLVYIHAIRSLKVKVKTLNVMCACLSLLCVLTMCKPNRSAYHQHNHTFVCPGCAWVLSFDKHTFANAHTHV